MDECFVHGIVLAVCALVLRLRFNSDHNIGIQVVECPDEIGVDNIAAYDATYCDHHDGRRHVQGCLSISAPSLLASRRFVGPFDTVHGLRGTWFDPQDAAQTTHTFVLARSNAVPSPSPIAMLPSCLASMPLSGVPYHSHMTCPPHRPLPHGPHPRTLSAPDVPRHRLMDAVADRVDNVVPWQRRPSDRVCVLCHAHVAPPAGLVAPHGRRHDDDLARVSGRVDYELEAVDRPAII
ncbi:Aste57867_5604 [Aphanomyces stellatus]|uniref:Aste57867_5604 protein n=1 Tax=Aphanomyces stellatus TaxID=120398 RepID=A0A485KHD9_9STRA|nr:hypothetical protein As57867_005591 [Aphanomyces stellatus]VFT82650.1 Aste57867_5604 [Aphanomyces stellatus]